MIPAKFAKLVVKQVDAPVPQGTDILVRVHSAAINPVDYKIQVSGRFFDNFPRVLGSDIAGVVVSVGSDQKKIKEGDRVFSFVPIFRYPEAQTAWGAFQQYTLTSDNATAIVPEFISLDSASTIPLALSTVADGYYNFLGFERPVTTPRKTDEWLLVWGGASSVGQYAIQLGVASGKKIITTASKQWHEELRKLGASETVDYHDADVVDQIKHLTNGSLKSIYDSVATKESVAQTLECLKESGGKVAYTQLTPETAGVECPNTITYTRVFAGSLLTPEGRDLGHAIFDWAASALSDGRLVPNLVKLRDGGVDGVQETLDYYKDNGIQFGKYVFNP